MRTISYRLDDLKKAVICIGKVNENEYTRVKIDAGDLYAEYPNAEASMTVQPPAGEAYPAVVTRDGSMVIWDVPESALTEEGDGEIQLTFTAGEVKVKSEICRMHVSRSIVGDGEAPEPVQDWIDNAEEVLAEIENAFPEGGTTGQVLAKRSDADFDTEWVDQSGGGGTSDYEELENLPQIGGVELKGNKTLHDLGAAAESDIPDVSGFYTKPASGIPASDIAAGVIPDPTSIIDDTSEAENKVWSAEKSTSLLSALNHTTPEMFGAKGDGVTDDTQAVQDAVDAGYAVYFASNKTYYLASAVTVDHDCHLFGGENTVIKTSTPATGTINEAFICTGTLKKETTITSDYIHNGDASSNANAGDRFEFDDMTDINVGDIIVIQATDQYYSYARQYYYLGGTLLVADVTDDYIFTSDTLPFDIEKTENVTVNVYNAPEVIIENLQFISETEQVGTYKYQLNLQYCKNSIVRNCHITEADNGLFLMMCVNTLVDGIFFADMPGWIGGVAKDTYGIGLYSCQNTVIKRVVGNTANSCIDVSGTIPSINTYIKECNLFAMNRHNGFGMHESAYNTILEDCVIGGMTGYGPMTINRCRFVRSYRNPSQSVGISYRGSHKEEWARLYVNNCIFEGNDVPIIFKEISPQNPIQAFDHVIGEVIISDCYGGRLDYIPAVSATILSNTIRTLTLVNWDNVYEFYHNDAGIVDNMVVENCNFLYKIWANHHSQALNVNNIRHLRIKSDYPKQEKMFVDINKFGGTYYLPEGVPIACSSESQTDVYTVCGKNFIPNKVADLCVGKVSGSQGEVLTRTEYDGFSTSLSVNSNNEIVFKQPNSSTVAAIYPKCLIYVPKNHTIRMSCKLKNTGETTGATFRAYIAKVDCKTGLITYRNNGTTEQATASGATVTHMQDTESGDSLVLCYVNCAVAVANSETTLSEFVAEVFDPDMDNGELTFDEYTGATITGDGSLTSIAGMNNLMTTSSNFRMKFKVDYMDKLFAQSAVGVSF